MEITQSIIVMFIFNVFLILLILPISKANEYKYKMLEFFANGKEEEVAGYKEVVAHEKKGCKYLHTFLV